MKHLRISHLFASSCGVLCLLVLSGCPEEEDNNASSEDMSSTDMATMQDMSSVDMTAGEDAGTDQGESDMSEDMALEADMSSDDMSAGDMGEQEELEVLGQWASIYSTETISQEAWGFYTLVEYDNDANVAITQNGDDGTDFALKFNRLVWTEPAADGSFYYCTSDFGKETAEEAKADPTEVDDSNPDVEGCGGFAWTRLVPNDEIEVAGDYESNFGSMETITSQAWNNGYLIAAVISFNNANNVVITQNPDGEPETFPNTFSRIVWTDPVADGSFYYCTSDLGKETAEEAAMMPTMVDDTDPDTGGCGGFPWTKLTVAP